MGYRGKFIRRIGHEARVSNSARIGLVLLVAGALSTAGQAGAGVQAAPPSTTSAGRCASGPCPLNIGGTFAWRDNNTSVTGQFTGSLVLFPRIAQVPCAAGAAADTSRPPEINTPGGPLHPGLIVPFPFSAPGPGRPLAAYIDVAVYHGPGTYTNASFAHQTYAYPAGAHYQTSPTESPGTAWSITMAADGSGNLTYSGPAQDFGPVQINLSMSWKCNDGATPQVVGQNTVAPTTTQPGLLLPPRPQRTGYPSTANVVLIVVSAVLLVAILAILGLVFRTRRRQRRRPPCDCQVAISVDGPSRIGVRDCARPAHWVITGHLAAEVLIADGIEGRHVTALLRAECTGGGTAEITSVAWTVQQTGADHLTITAHARILIHCQGGEVEETAATGQYVVTLVVHPCCGPDITDVFLATVNTSFDRLIANRPLSPTVFMIANGFRMICRPFAPGTFTPGGCPSSNECADTVTIVGRCVDCYVPDNFLFGAIAGWLDLPVAEMAVMGWGAKLTKSNLEVLPGHVISEKLWNEGHALGLQAHTNRQAGRPYHLDRVALERALRVSQSRDDCGNCDQPATAPFFIDFGKEPWR